MSMRRRLEDLEGRAAQRSVPEQLRSWGARQRMKEHLDKVAKLRRGELDPEEVVEVEAMSAAIKSRLASRRGEVGR